MFALSHCVCNLSYSCKRKQLDQLCGSYFLKKPVNFRNRILRFQPALLASNVEEIENVETEIDENPKYRWVRVGPDITEDQKEAISRLPPKMTNRCKAFMKQIICFSPEINGSLSLLVAWWVKSTVPRRADWLAVLKELSILDHPFYLEVLCVSHFKASL